jgi:hypothetical protein
MLTIAGRALRRNLGTDTRCVRTLLTVLLLGAAGCSATAPNQADTWGSDQASLTVSSTTATLLLVASGGCYGSYGNLDRPPPSGSFSILGSYTQLIGAYPGKLTYAARFTGAVDGRQISLSVTVPTLHLTLGPFALTQGVTAMWPACAYP